jgi:hypothetical protein
VLLTRLANLRTIFTGSAREAPKAQPKESIKLLFTE